ncbi:hypothetical protein MKEN_01501500 [Mycena kentingensis (nom. inval.)]|nr:hypothetical protein MKEN_01501500 [Mycena kentingensis (nom. inval.)]
MSRISRLVNTIWMRLPGKLRPERPHPELPSPEPPRPDSPRPSKSSTIKSDIEPPSQTPPAQFITFPLNPTVDSVPAHQEFPHTSALLQSVLRIVATDYLCEVLYQNTYNEVYEPPLHRSSSTFRVRMKLALRSPSPNCTRRESSGEVTNTHPDKEATLGYMQPCLNREVVEAYESTFVDVPQPLEAARYRRRCMFGILLSITLMHELVHSWIRNVLLRRGMPEEDMLNWVTPKLLGNPGNDAGDRFEELMFSGRIRARLEHKSEIFEKDRCQRFTGLWFQPVQSKTCYKLDDPKMKAFYEALLAGPQPGRVFLSSVSELKKDVTNAKSTLPQIPKHGVLCRISPESDLSRSRLPDALPLGDTVEDFHHYLGGCGVGLARQLAQRREQLS